MSDTCTEGTEYVCNYRQRAKKAEAELARLRALCAARPKTPPIYHERTIMALEEFIAAKNKWTENIDAAGRGEDTR